MLSVCVVQLWFSFGRARGSVVCGLVLVGSAMVQLVMAFWFRVMWWFSEGRHDGSKVRRF